MADIVITIHVDEILDAKAWYAPLCGFGGKEALKGDAALRLVHDNLLSSRASVMTYPCGSFTINAPLVDHIRREFSMA